MQFKRVHKTHWQMVTDSEIISFNPEKQSFENMEAGFFAIKFNPANLLQLPERNKEGKLLAVESNIKDG